MANKTIDQLTSKANPVDADLLVIADSADNNEMKQITIGSITADIGDGLIVDGSASSTTTYSSTKIAADNTTQDAALTAGLALKVAKAGDTMTGQFVQAKGADIASATTTDLSAATGNYVDITGTTTITSFGTETAGCQMKVRFTGILTLTYNATSLILPTGASITTAVGDVAELVSLGSGNWRCTSYTRFDGTPLGGANITNLTEDTTGDMDADFAFVYDNSAGANRKQKVNVFRATDAEADAGSSTTKFITPSQNAKYSVNTNTRSDWGTYLAGEDAMRALSGSPPKYFGAVYFSPNSATTSAGVAQLDSGLMGSGSTTVLTHALTKDYRMKWRMKFDNASNIQGVGLVVTPATVYTAQTDTTNGTIRFVWNAGTLYAHNANGTSTNTNITSGLTMTNWYTYEIVVNPGTDIKFYIDGVLKATHTTNLPTTGTPLFCEGASNNADTSDVAMTPITISYEF